jgi:hypothetical protein
VVTRRMACSISRTVTHSEAVSMSHCTARFIALCNKMGCLGPIDPSVTNIFNPPNPVNPGQLAPISVEDVTAFFELVEEEWIRLRTGGATRVARNRGRATPPRDQQCLPPP